MYQPTNQAVNKQGETEEVMVRRVKIDRGARPLQAALGTSVGCSPDWLPACTKERNALPCS